MKYIIDGYNMVYKIERLKTKPPRLQREGLVNILELAQSQSSQLKDITVVFDGQRHISSPQTFSTVKIIFSRNSCADKKIKELVERSTFARDIVVVSDDRQVRGSVTALRAKCLSVHEFLNKCTFNPGKPIEFRLNEKTKNKINEELEHLWLRKA